MQIIRALFRIFLYIFSFFRQKRLFVHVRDTIKTAIAMAVFRSTTYTCQVNNLQQLPTTFIAHELSKLSEDGGFNFSGKMNKKYIYT